MELTKNHNHLCRNPFISLSDQKKVKPLKPSSCCFLSLAVAPLPVGCSSVPGTGELKLKPPPNNPPKLPALLTLELLPPKLKSAKKELLGLVDCPVPPRLPKSPSRKPAPSAVGVVLPAGSMPLKQNEPSSTARSLPALVLAASPKRSKVASFYKHFYLKFKNI